MYGLIESYGLEPLGVDLVQMPPFQETEQKLIAKFEDYLRKVPGMALVAYSFLNAPWEWWLLLV